MDTWHDESVRRMETFTDQMTATTRWVFVAIFAVVTALSGFLVAARSESQQYTARVEASVVANHDERMEQMRGIDVKLTALIQAEASNAATLQAIKERNGR